MQKHVTAAVTWSDSDPKQVPVSLWVSVSSLCAAPFSSALIYRHLHISISISQREPIPSNYLSPKLPAFPFQLFKALINSEPCCSQLAVRTKNNLFESTHTNAGRAWQSLNSPRVSGIKKKLLIIPQACLSEVISASQPKWSQNSRHSGGKIFLGWWRSARSMHLSLVSSMLNCLFQSHSFLYFWTSSFSKAFCLPRWLFWR